MRTSVSFQPSGPAMSSCFEPGPDPTKTLFGFLYFCLGSNLSTFRCWAENNTSFDPLPCRISCHWGGGGRKTSFSQAWPAYMELAGILVRTLTVPDLLELQLAVQKLKTKEAKAVKGQIWPITLLKNSACTIWCVNMIRPESDWAS